MSDDSPDDEARAFNAAMMGIHQRVEALKIAFPKPAHRTALQTIQRTCALMVAAIGGSVRK